MIGTLAAVQLGLGAVGAIKNMINPKEKASVSSATSDLVKQTNQMKNITQAAGTAQMQANARQTQADTLGQAGMQTDDPNKLAAIASATNLQGLKAGQQRDALTQQQRLQGQQAHTQALGRLSAEEQRVQDMNRADFDASAASASNLIGAGVENFQNISKDKFMTDAYSKIEKGQDVDMSGYGKVFPNLRNFLFNNK